VVGRYASGHRGRSNRARHKINPASWARYAAPLHVGAADLADWVPDLIDIGFGTGESLLHAVTAYPGRRILGVETYETGVLRAARWLDEQAVTSVRLSSCDIRELLPALPAAGISEIRAFFPDPWPKRGHAGRRLFTAAFVSAIAEIVRPGGILWIATDSADYAVVIEALLANEPRLVVIDEPPESRPPTKYASIAIAAGRNCRNFVARRVT
jgi:tRNA (guanine-N7-)-methyltransferase